MCLKWFHQMSLLSCDLWLKCYHINGIVMVGFVHYDDVIMTMLASQITSRTVVYSIVYSGVNQRKYQSFAPLAFVREIHRGPVNFPYKWPVTRKMFPFDDVIMLYADSSSQVLVLSECHYGRSVPLVAWVYCIVVWYIFLKETLMINKAICLR